MTANQLTLYFEHSQSELLREDQKCEQCKEPIPEDRNTIHIRAFPKTTAADDPNRARTFHAACFVREFKRISSPAGIRLAYVYAASDPYCRECRKKVRADSPSVLVESSGFVFIYHPACARGKQFARNTIVLAMPRENPE